jgi:periplasmic protein TonB
MSIKTSGKTAAMVFTLAAFLIAGLQAGSLKAQEKQEKKVTKTTTTKTTTTVKDNKVPPPPPPPPVPQKKVTKTKDESGRVAYTQVKVMPQFPGGEDARMQYMVKAIKYPTAAKETGIQGTVNISFIVEKNGTITNTKVVKGIGSGCDEEALRVVKEMPKWKPGKHKGKAVRVQMVMPIKFALS